MQKERKKKFKESKENSEGSEIVLVAGYNGKSESPTSPIHQGLTLNARHTRRHLNKETQQA